MWLKNMFIKAMSSSLRKFYILEGLEFPFKLRLIDTTQYYAELGLSDKGLFVHGLSVS